MAKGGKHKRVASKGHFAVYTSDGERFELPLAYLRSDIFRELLRLSEDEYGLPGDGPVRVACNASFMQHVMEVLGGRASEDVQREVLTLILVFRKCS